MSDLPFPFHIQETIDQYFEPICVDVCIEYGLKSNQINVYVLGFAQPTAFRFGYNNCIADEAWDAENVYIVSIHKSMHPSINMNNFDIADFINKKETIEESEHMLTFLPLLNLLIFIGLLIGISWFMITVVRLLTKIESRLENLEKTMNNNKRP